MVKEKIWEIQPHTQAKLEILKKYLNAWLPIITRFNKKVIYIDGFAGPGIYKNGEEGSPIVAIKSLLNHKFIPSDRHFKFLFIEKDKERAKILEKELNKINLPNTEFTYDTKIMRAEFEDIISEILDFIEDKGSNLAPAFVFIDPFGMKGISMNSIKRIMSHKSCEVLINFMYEEINRFISLPKNEETLNNLFGSNEWKKIKNVNSSDKRYAFLKELYQRKLRENCGDCFIRTFEMKNKFNREDYVLFFCTKKPQGMIRMKEAMWKIDETGNFNFSDATYDPKQKLLFQKNPRYSVLKRIILDKFHGKKVQMQELIDFVNLETPFLERHIRQPILKPLEFADKIEVMNRKKKNTFPKESIIKFKD